MKSHVVLSVSNEDSTLECSRCGQVPFRRALRRPSEAPRHWWYRPACPNGLEEKREATNRAIEANNHPALSLHWSQEMRELYRDSGEQS